MKTLFYVLTALLLSTFTLSAQQHLKFLDVDIDGPLEEFCQELSLRGYQPIQDVSDNIRMMETNINGQPIDLLVVASEDAQHVYRVVFFTQPKMSWKWLRKEYYYYKKLLTEAYGAPTKYVEMFMAPYNTRKKLRRKQIPAIVEGKGRWVTFFSIHSSTGQETGTAMVQIAPSGSLARVIVVYEDTANAALYSPDPIDTDN